MAVKLRLARAGAKKVPYYKIVATDSRSSRNGKFIEQIGIYDPKQDPALVRFDDSKLDHWLGVGATPTLVVKELVRRHKKQASV